MQTSLDFTHGLENNQESNQNYFQQKDKFSSQCKYLLKLLQQGVKMTTYTALVIYKIGHLQRRIKDLRDAGIQINDRWITTDTGRLKEYYL